MMEFHLELGIGVWGLKLGCRGLPGRRRSSTISPLFSSLDIIH